MKKLIFTEELELTLNLCCYAYYVKSSPLVTDFQYDMLEKQYEQQMKSLPPFRGIELESAYPKEIIDMYEYVIKTKIKLGVKYGKKENSRSGKI